MNDPSQPKEKMRLQKYLAHQGVASRRAIEKMITEKRITVNGRIAEVGLAVTGSETITVDGKKIEVSEQKDSILLAFYKPRGVESTLSSTEGNECLGDFNFGPDRVFPVGRLDKESHGLLLMTNDGELANQLTHPSYEHEKEYMVIVDKELTPRHLTRLSNGSLTVEGKKVNPAHTEQLSPDKFRIILTEGRNRQIRKMCDAVGLTVRDLKRVRIADEHIKNLRPGEWRDCSKN